MFAMRARICVIRVAAMLVQSCFFEIVLEVVVVIFIVMMGDDG